MSTKQKIKDSLVWFSKNPESLPSKYPVRNRTMLSLKMGDQSLPLGFVYECTNGTKWLKQFQWYTTGHLLEISLPFAKGGASTLERAERRLKRHVVASLYKSFKER